MYHATDVGSRVRYFRKLRGWSQEKLALNAGINPAFLGHLERGMKSPTITTLEKLTAALDITLEELFAQNIETDDSRQTEIKRILYTIRDLEEAELKRMADIIQKVMEFKN